MRGAQGFSIVEAIMATLVLAIGVVAIIPIFVSNAKLNSDAEIRTGALAVAERVVDDFRQRPFDQWTAIGDADDSPDSVDLVWDTGLRSFDVEASWDVGDLDLGDGGETRHLRVDVYLGETRRATLETVYTEFDDGN